MVGDRVKQGMILDGRYLLEEEIGRGGFGVTYKGVNQNNGQVVAVKTFGEDTSREKVLREARILKDFSGEPAIVSVLDYFEEEGLACIVMEYLEGETLRARIRSDGKWSPERTVRAFDPVMQALGKIHNAGVIHRDISPDNIMVLPDGSLRLLDFGAARHYDGSTSTLSGVYKSSYSPPEHMDGRGETGPYTDVYSLCAVLYFCVTGSDPEDVLSRLLYDELEPPSKLGADLLPHAERALLGGLVLDSRDRTQSVTELAGVLDEVYPDLTEEEQRERERKRRRRRKRIAALVVCFLFAAGLVAFRYRTEILFRFIETEEAVLDGSSMTDEEFRKSAHIVEERAAAFSGGKYLWKTMDRNIRLEVPYEAFDGSLPQSLIRQVLTRPMALTITGTNSAGEEIGYGRFSQGKDTEALTRQDKGLVLILSEEAGGRFDGLLEEEGRPLKLWFDKGEKYDSVLYLNAETLGNGREILVHAGEKNLPDELLSLLLTKGPSPKPFTVESEWKVVWETRETSMFPGKNQVDPADLEGVTACFCYGYSYTYRKETDGFDAAGFSLLAVLKNRLDSLERPYAIGRLREEPDKLVVRMETEGIWYEELDLLAKRISVYLGSRTARSNIINPKEIRPDTREDGSSVIEYSLMQSDGTSAEKTVNTLLDQEKERIFLYLDYDGPVVASADAGEALASLRKNSTIVFDRWELAGEEKMDENSIHFARFLNSAVQQSPQIDYKLIGFQILNADDSKAYSEDLETWYPAHQREIPSGLFRNWREEYHIGDDEYHPVTGEYYIYFYEKDLSDPKAALEDFLRLYHENQEFLEEDGAISKVYVYLHEGPKDSGEGGNRYVSLPFSVDFDTGRLLVDYASVWSGDPDWDKNVEDAFNKAFEKDEELAGLVKENPYRDEIFS